MKHPVLVKYLISILTVLTLAACSSSETVSPSQKLGLVQLGMSKVQVTEIMGTPGATAAQYPYEYYFYSHITSRVGAFFEGYGAGVAGNGAAYLARQTNNNLFVRFDGEIVESYGRRGDFEFTRVDVPESQPNANYSDSDNSYEMNQLENRQRELEAQQRRLEDEQRYQNRPNPFPG